VIPYGPLRVAPEQIGRSAEQTPGMAPYCDLWRLCEVGHRMDELRLIQVWIVATLGGVVGLGFLYVRRVETGPGPG
jgi:hypothetical protein